MKNIPRILQSSIRHHLKRGKSILLLGPRQTGKSTLVQELPADFDLSFLIPDVRLRYEKNPELLLGELQSFQGKNKPLVVLDEIQKVPKLMDTVQYAIDKGIAQFVLTGSSARKLKRGGAINLLPGRIVSMRMSPFLLIEYPRMTLSEALLFGSLPAIQLQENRHDKEADLRSYVETYLQEEVRAEALVRQMGPFLRFLELAGLESGKIVSFRELSQDIGIAHTTIAAYYQILEDCLIVERIDPLIKSATRKKLMKSSRYLFFDMGVRRICAQEGMQFPKSRLGELFKHFVGLELLYLSRLMKTGRRILYWRDADGPEVDFVIDDDGHYTPIEVKLTDTPKLRHTKYLQVFMHEYKVKKGYVVCNCERTVELNSSIRAISWRHLSELFDLPS